MPPETGEEAVGRGVEVVVGLVGAVVGVLGGRGGGEREWGGEGGQIGGGEVKRK